MLAEIEVKKITVAEFHGMEFTDDDPFQYELLDGELVKKNAPAPRHQDILSELNDQIKPFVRKNQLGRVFFAPVDVFLNEDSAPQPDYVFVSKANEGIITTNGIEGVPDLVVEIISPTSIVRDRVTKKSLYERAGVQEYWLVDPQNGEIEIYGLKESRYELLSAATPLEGELKSEVLAGLVIDMKTLFQAT